MHLILNFLYGWMLRDLPTSIAISIAEGCMNPITKEVFDSKAHDQLHTSITVRKASTIHIRRQQDSQTPYRNEIGTSIFSIGEMSEEKIKGKISINIKMKSTNNRNCHNWISQRLRL